jgi:hypothetical protein
MNPRSLDLECLESKEYKKNARNDRVMTARCCGCGRAQELGKELVEKKGKKGGKKGKKKKNAGLLTWPAFK